MEMTDMGYCDFYLSLGAQAMDEWTVYRLTGESLHRLAGE